MNHLTFRNERIFFIATSIYFLLTNLIGFGFSLNTRIETEGSLAGHIYIHGICAGLWILLYFIQTTLISANNLRMHMKLGKLGALILILVLVSGIYVAFMVPVLYNIEPPYSQPGRDASVTLLAVILGFYGLYKRANPFVHKRLMMVSTLILSSAGIGRFAQIVGLSTIGPVGVIALLLLSVVCLIIFDYVNSRKFYKVNFMGMGMVFFIFLLAAPPLWENDFFQPIFITIIELLS